jgi:hypothetical protein
MANTQFTIEELNYIAKQLTEETYKGLTTEEKIQNILPEGKSEQVTEILNEMKSVGLLKEDLSLNNLIAPAIAEVMYFNEDNTLNSDDRVQCQQEATEKLFSGEITNLDINEYFIIDGY